MKQIINNYTFDKTTRTVTFTDFSSISQKRLFMVTNVSKHTIIYQFNEPTLGGSVSGKVLTLSYDTSSMSDSDQLQIIYDCAEGDPVYDASSNSSTVQGDIAAGNTDSGNPVKVGGIYKSTAPTLTDGQRGDLQVDNLGSLKITNATLLAGEDLANDVLKVEERYTYSVISTATTAPIRGGAGFLHRIIVTGGSAGTITVYDNTSGSGTILLNFSSTNTPASYEINAQFNVGLTVVTSAATYLTVIYR